MLILYVLYILYIYVFVSCHVAHTFTHVLSNNHTYIYTYTFHTTDGMVQNFSLNPMFFPHDWISWLTPERLRVILIDILEQWKEMIMFTEFGY